VNLSVLLKLGRVSNLPTVWSNVLAGAVLGGGKTDPPTLFLIMLAASLFYIGGMYLNDAFDREIDARERPERPIPAGAVAATTVFGGGFGMLAGGAAVAMVAARNSGASAQPVLGTAAALALAIIAYDVAHKGVALSPVVMGACRGLVYLLAAVASGGEVDSTVLVAACAMLAYVAGLTYVASQENLHEVKNLWPLALLAAPAAAALFIGSSLQSPVIVALALAVWVGRAVLLLTGDGRRDVRGAVTRLIAGISLVDALAIAASGSSELAVVAASGLALTYLAQRFVPAT